MKRILMVLVLGLTACPNPGNYEVAYAPRVGQTSQPRADAIQHAVIAMTDAGQTVESSDVATGIVMSTPIRQLGFLGSMQDDSGYRFRVRVTLSTEGAYEIVALCAFGKPGLLGTTVEECAGSNQRPQFIIDVLNKIDASLR